MIRGAQELTQKFVEGEGRENVLLQMPSDSRDEGLFLEINILRAILGAYLLPFPLQ